MKTKNIYIATLSVIVNKDYKDKLRLNSYTVPLNMVLVKKKGKYPKDIYIDMNTGVTYNTDKQNLNVGDVYIDTLRTFNFVTKCKDIDLPKKKILRMFDNVVGGKNEKSI